MIRSTWTSYTLGNCWEVGVFFPVAENLLGLQQSGSNKKDRNLMATKGGPNLIHPRCYMYAILAYIWLKLMVHVGKYSIHGAYGHGPSTFDGTVLVFCFCLQNKKGVMEPKKKKHDDLTC